LKPESAIEHDAKRMRGFTFQELVTGKATQTYALIAFRNNGLSFVRKDVIAEFKRTPD